MSHRKLYRKVTVRLVKNPRAAQQRQATTIVCESPIQFVRSVRAQELRARVTCGLRLGLEFFNNNLNVSSDTACI